MKTKIVDMQTLQLEKQRLKIVISNQEKEMAENFAELKEKLQPTKIMKGAILGMIPIELRENKITSIVTSLILQSINHKQSIGNEIFSVAKSTLLGAAIKYLDKYRKRKKEEGNTEIGNWKLRIENDQSYSGKYNSSIVYI